MAILGRVSAVRSFARRALPVAASLIFTAAAAKACVLADRGLRQEGAGGTAATGGTGGFGGNIGGGGTGAIGGGGVGGIGGSTGGGGIGGSTGGGGTGGDPQIVEFGLGKLNNWTAFTTQTNVQHTNITDLGEQDGEVILSFISPTTVEDWIDLSGGWSETGSGISEINPAGQLRQFCTPAPPSYTQLENLTWLNAGTADNTSSWFHMVKIDVPGTSTTTAGSSGFMLTRRDGTKHWSREIRSDGVNVDIYDTTTGWVKFDTTKTVDTRWHIMGEWNDNSSTPVGAFVIDGAEVLSDLSTVNVSADPGYTMILARRETGDNQVEHHIAWSRYFNSITPWVTSDGILESDASNPLFDGGANREWTSVAWTANGVVTVQAKTADSVANLAGASLFPVTSGFGFTEGNQNRFLQLNITLQDQNNGQRTAVLESLEATHENEN